MKLYEASHVFRTIVPLVLLKQLKIVVHVVDIQIARLAHQLGPFALIPHVVHQSTLHLRDSLLAEGALLLLGALGALIEVPLSVLVCERVVAAKRASELAHV